MSIGLAIVVVAAGAAVGVLSGLFGVGGGTLMVPFMVFALDATQHSAEGTSLLVIVPTAVAGALTHMKERYVSFSSAGLLGAGGVLGAYAGATLALQIEGATLRVIFGVVLALIGLRLMVQGRRQMVAERNEGS